MKTVLFKVNEIHDPFFGRTISRNGDEIARVFNYYAYNRDKSIRKEQFTYRDWYGSETRISCHISAVIVSSKGACYVGVTCSHDIPNHYIPSPSEVIGRRYSSRYQQCEQIYGEVVKRYM
jgi:hypothetical protein